MSDRLASTLALRIARVVALAVLALPALGAACGGKVVLDGTGGAGTSTSAAGGAGGMPACSTMSSDCNSVLVMVCFAPNPGQTCPDAADAMPFLMDGCDIMDVQAACSGGPAGECCYNATEECCG